MDALVKVKPLVWEKSHFNSWRGDWHTVPTGYTIRCADENGWKWQGVGGFGYANSDDAAKAAAEADYASRILAAIDATAVSDILAAKDAEIARLRDALTLIERLYYIEGKDAAWRATRMNAVAYEAQSDAPDLGRFHRIFPRAALSEETP
jgi:hypothetical protein